MSTAEVNAWVTKWFGGANPNEANPGLCQTQSAQYYHQAQTTGLTPGTSFGFSNWYNTCTNMTKPIPSYIGPDIVPPWGVYAGTGAGAVLSAIKTSLDPRWTLLGALGGAGAGWLLQHEILPYAESSNLLYAAVGGAAFGGLDLLFSAGQNKESAIVFAALGAAWSYVVAEELVPYAAEKWQQAESIFASSHVSWWGFLIPGYNLYELYKLFSSGDVTATGEAAEAAAAYTGIGAGYLLLTAGVLLNVSAVREKVVSLSGGSGSNLTSLLPLLLA